jgi:hypothetical protein
MTNTLYCRKVSNGINRFTSTIELMKLIGIIGSIIYLMIYWVRQHNRGPAIPERTFDFVPNENHNRGKPCMIKSKYIHRAHSTAVLQKNVRSTNQIIRVDTYVKSEFGSNATKTKHKVRQISTIP